MSDLNPPISEDGRSVEGPPRLEGLKLVAHSILEGYAQTLRAFATAAGKPKYTGVIDSLCEDFSFTADQMNVAEVEVRDREFRDGDIHHERSGAGPGIALTINLRDRLVYMNIQGGVRVPDAPMDLRDGQYSKIHGTGHADRTDQIHDRGVEINVNVLKRPGYGRKHELHSDSKIFLRSSEVVLQTLLAEGFYTDDLKQRVLRTRDLTDVRSINQRLVSPMKQLLAIRSQNRTRR